ncbi:Uncharacterised protein [Clostridioides difficile]|uniref:Uncharacterized protein n=1 Tax=Clostridioides difficile TaxID=1496 RepID=A0AB74R3P3_CLODI|nr:DUF6809 family protein [Clostridioides difficile]OFU02676.1 hypothetical protein HMPREF3085_07405 [Clostridium sp. HMSC19E03]OFU15540.1 hypothetical protein HMPREF3078_16535 [Clostridium sp. HMSC19C08]OFU18240.1 hypothetical protein HMPREF3079_08280 [Clostridium sp. HMSC19C09]OFU18839.1 hypothetical protein HMPREF3077_14110 [Clostridium sp. HMSC19C05]OFU34398.1 hypothetical protein HMPREF3074_04895 [Clostridium sp. HMSC19B10]OFU40504.1 hypothetical protein HMPREF3072_13090 [Clostridium sp.
MYDEIIEIYFDYWINEHMYRSILEKDEYYIECWKEVKKINELLEINLEDDKKYLLVELNDLFNSLIEFERELSYKLGFKTGAKFIIELLK